MKDWVVMAMQRLDDALHERVIRKLCAEYRRDVRHGRDALANAVLRDIQRAVELRSPEQWTRMARRDVRRMDPHAWAVLDRMPRA